MPINCSQIREFSEKNLQNCWKAEVFSKTNKQSMYWRHGMVQCGVCQKNQKINRWDPMIYFL